MHGRGGLVHVPRHGGAGMSELADTAIHRRVERLRRGEDPTLVARMPSGWAVLGEQQFLRGYCLLLPDPVVGTLNELSGFARLRVLSDTARLGDALLAATGARRINYAIFGNLEPALHIHLVPRYEDEAEGLRTAHPWQYDWAAAPAFDANRDARLLQRIRDALRD
jgi:diadenosine tetraphosphate (Ap4A) HIT family hydrolase